MRRMTVSPFLVFIVLVSLSWFMELGLGWIIVRWYWGSSWYTWGESASSMAGLTASLFGAYQRWTAEGVLSVFFAVYVLIHIVVAVWGVFLRPFFQRMKLGVRPPIGREVEQFERAFAAIARSAQEPIQGLKRWLVAEGPGLDMRWHGYVLIVDRGLLGHRYFVPLLAHQLGHVNSEDRLAHRLYEMLPATKVAVATLVGFPLALGHVLMYPFWMWYWKERIYMADAFAVSCGQGHQLVRALSEIYLPVDVATRWGRLLKPVPYVAQRVGRIRCLLVPTRPGAPRVI
jgi:hypothetical protein